MSWSWKLTVGSETMYEGDDEIEARMKFRYFKDRRHHQVDEWVKLFYNDKLVAVHHDSN